METQMVRYDAMVHAIAECANVDEVKELRDQAQAVAAYYRQARNFELEQKAIEIRLRAERKTGELLKGLPRASHNRGNQHVAALHDETQPPSDYAATLDRVGIDRKTAGRYQKLAEVPEDKFEAALHSEKIRPSTAQIIKLAQGGTIASLHTGDEESYTPSNYLESAREVMGGFDLDPASNEMAQANVQAAKYFTVDDDGLSQDWSGRVWMNPPYTARVINGFIAKLVEHYQSGDVTEAICLTNNNTDTSWFHGAVDNGDAVCFTAGRINFLKRDGSKSSPTNGQCFIYFGPNVDKFKEVFSAHGIVMVKA